MQKKDIPNLKCIRLKTCATNQSLMGCKKSKSLRKNMQLMHFKKIQMRYFDYLMFDHYFSEVEQNNREQILPLST